MAIVPCAVTDCNAMTGMKGTARGWCSKHYNRWLRNGDPLVRSPRKIIERCMHDNCDKPHDAKGLCSAHLTNLRRHGTPNPRKRGEVVDGKKICNDCAEDKPLSEFYPAGKSIAPRCKPCSAVHARAYRESRIELVREQFRNSAAKRANQRRDTAKKRRAALRSVRIEDVSALEVYDRGNWICGLCEAPIPRVTVWPHPLSPSVDHIQPISLGGEHSYANTQPAHLTCNMSKGNRIAA